MTDFNFLRIKWPKLAAIAADASRLVEVSPSSAISTMQNFCEWAADIALDFYDINTQNGITQQEKLETLKATGHVPQDIQGRFNDIMLAGGRRLYKVNEDVEEARQCIEDIYEIGRWLNKEADRSGWPPKNDYYRPAASSMGLSSDGGNFSSGRFGQIYNNYKPLILGGAVGVVLIVLLIWGVSSLFSTNVTANPTIFLTPTPTVTSTDLLETSPDITPTPPPETVVFLDTLTPTSTHKESFFLKKWGFASGDKDFTIGDKKYQNGIGMYIPKKSISKTQGTWSMKFKLDKPYSKLRFDLGVDAAIQYGAGYGKYRIMIYSNTVSADNLLYDSKQKEYTFVDLGKEVSIESCTTLIIQLTESKGTKGTINVVLGDIRLVAGGEPAASPTPTGSDDASASPSPTPSGSVSPSDTVEASASPTATATDNVNGGEQNQGPQE